MKKMIIGLVLGLLIGTAGTTLATNEMVQVAFAKFTFIVNDEEKTLDADPIVYQGNTYLPVRTVANILGFDVTYKADSRTIKLNTPNEVARMPEVSIIEQISIIENRLVTANKRVESIAFLLGDEQLTGEQRDGMERDLSQAEGHLADLEAQIAALKAQQ